MKVGELYIIKYNDQYLDDRMHKGQITVSDRMKEAEPITAIFLGYESDELDEERIDALKNLREHAKDLRKRAPDLSKNIEGNIISKINESLNKDPNPKALLRFLFAGGITSIINPSNVSLQLISKSSCKNKTNTL